MDAFAATRLAAGMGFLMVAAWSDIRTRTVRDPLWIALGTLGLALATAETAVQSAAPERFALVGATAILFYAIFFGRPVFDEDGVHLRLSRLAVLGLAVLLVVISAAIAMPSGGADYEKLLTMPVMVLVYQGLFYARVLHGGADAKALIAITLLVPTYPAGTPVLLAASPRFMDAMQLFFPFSLVVFVDGAILFLLVPLAYLVYNGARGDLQFPQALLGYRANLEALPKHVWLMERIDEKGEHYLVLFPKRGKNQSKDIERLRQAGVERPWVQPKMPFLAPLSFGFLLSFLLGNLLLLPFPSYLA